MQTTIKKDPYDVFELLEGTLGGYLEAGKGLNGYQSSMNVMKHGETLVKVLYGGINPFPNLITSGSATDEVSPVIREAWPVHNVTRMDSAQDFDTAGGYDKVRETLLSIHENSTISTREIESSIRGTKSRTMYLGSPSSRVRLRLYEKGRFEQQLGNSEASDNWFRLEVQVRPTGEAREKAAFVTPEEAWGFSPWTREIASRVMNLDVDRVTMQLKREPDYVRAIEALRTQYTKTLRKALNVEGSWDKVGELLGIF